MRHFIYCCLSSQNNFSVRTIRDAEIGQQKIVFSLSLKIIIVFMFFRGNNEKRLVQKGDCRKDNFFLQNMTLCKNLKINLRISVPPTHLRGNKLQIVCCYLLHATTFIYFIYNVFLLPEKILQIAGFIFQEIYLLRMCVCRLSLHLMSPSNVSS